MSWPAPNPEGIVAWSLPEAVMTSFIDEAVEPVASAPIQPMYDLTRFNAERRPIASTLAEPPREREARLIREERAELRLLRRILRWAVREGGVAAYHMPPDRRPGGSGGPISWLEVSSPGGRRRWLSLSEEEHDVFEEMLDDGDLVKPWPPAQEGTA